VVIARLAGRLRRTGETRWRIEVGACACGSEPDRKDGRAFDLNLAGASRYQIDVLVVGASPGPFGESDVQIWRPGVLPTRTV
jgi:hypothetical protein